MQNQISCKIQESSTKVGGKDCISYECSLFLVNRYKNQDAQAANDGDDDSLDSQPQNKIINKIIMNSNLD